MLGKTAVITHDFEIRRADVEHLLPHENPDTVFIDSEIEFLLVGPPAGAIHVAWNDGPI